MNYFKDCKTLQEAKILYKKLALQHHPDRGGDPEVMKAINLSYENFLKNGANKFDSEKFNEEIRLNEEYNEAISKVINLQGVLLELVGGWLWATGNTKMYKDIFKEAGYFYAPKKQAWYFRTEEWSCKGRKKKNLTLDQIRSKYGSKEIRKNELEKIEC